MSNTLFTLFVLGQLLRALASSTAAQYPQTYLTTMPVPADNVTVAGLVSDVTIIGRENPSTYINPVNPLGMVIPTTTVVNAKPLFGTTPITALPYHICPAYPNGGAPSNISC